MVDSIASGSLRAEALRAALGSTRAPGAAGPAESFDALVARMQDQRRAIDEGLAASPAGPVRESSAPVRALREGLSSVSEELNAIERLPEDVVSGRVTEFHEIASQVRRADLSLRYALEVRNRLIDAYREVMRMSV